MSNLYSTLGITPSASFDEIKRAYRKLAAQHHPDRGGDTKKFQEIQAAYDLLSDPEKRRQYDNPQPQFNFNPHGVPPGFEDIFNGMFGEDSPFGNMFGRRQSPQRNKNLSLQTTITLEDVFYGKELTVSVTLPSGKEQVCEIKIPKGIQDGTTLRLPNMGDDTFPHMPRGDIHLTVRIQPHHTFQRQGDDLIAKLEVNALDAILGKTYQLKTIDNKSLEIKVQPGTQPGTIMAAHGYGIPNINDNRFVGKLLIQVDIKIPTNLSEIQLQKIREANI